METSKKSVASNTLELAVARQYFSVSHLERLTIAPGRVSIGEFIFDVDPLRHELNVRAFPADQWLLSQQACLPPQAFVWELVAYIKTRIFQDPKDLRAKARTGELYDEDYYLRRGGGGPYVGYPLTVYGENLTDRFRELAGEIASRFPKARVLDIGCGPGIFVRELQFVGVDAKGVDISKWCVENAVTPKVYHGSVLAMPFNAESFDIEISQDVMEHIHPDDLRGALIEQIGTVRSGGILCHFIPFYEYPEPVSVDAHLCCANRDWWVRLFASFPELSIEQMAPEDNQWDSSNGHLSRYFILKVSK